MDIDGFYPDILAINSCIMIDTTERCSFISA